MSNRTPRYTNLEVVRLARKLGLEVRVGKGDHIHIRIGNGPMVTIRNGQWGKIANPAAMRLIRRAISLQAEPAPTSEPGRHARLAAPTGKEP